MNTAIIKITPENSKCPIDAQTNGVSNLDMIEHLQVLSKHFAQEIIRESKELGCDTDEDLDGYIKFLRANKL
jgi:CMP-2-keto-3-deoxyoctulosonic acid synthetase